MTDFYVSTHWRVKSGQETQFVNTWREALTWTKSAYPQLEHARLLRDEDDASHFVSFLEWADSETVDKWSADPEKERRQETLNVMCDSVDGRGYEEATRVG